MNAEIRRIAYGSEAYRQVWELREAVLRKPIGLSLRDEDLSIEDQEIILGVFEDDRLAACILLRPVSTRTVKFRQMAVRTDRQSAGVGRMLMHEAERTAWNEGFDRIELHARMTAAPFYVKLGYLPVGGEFTEVGIPHIAMIKCRKDAMQD